jgi:hypothetical protein
VAATFQAVGNLARLRRSEEASAPEAEAEGCASSHRTHSCGFSGDDANEITGPIG